MSAASSSTSLTWVQFWIFLALLANLRVECVSSPYLQQHYGLSMKNLAVTDLQSCRGDGAKDGGAAVAAERRLENAGEFGVAIGNVLTSLALR
jgi:hypothetical protein